MCYTLLPRTRSNVNASPEHWFKRQKKVALHFAEGAVPGARCATLGMTADRPENPDVNVV
jgi:hypothetical protein